MLSSTTVSSMDNNKECFFRIKATLKTGVMAAEHSALPSQEKKKTLIQKHILQFFNIFSQYYTI